MKQIIYLFLILVSLTLVACNDATNASDNAPSYIKETWSYFTAMSKVTEAVEGGENVKVAYDKHFPTEKELIAYISAAEEKSGSSDEEQIVIGNIHLMHLLISSMAIENYNASMGGDPVNIEQYVYELQVPRYELEKIYEKYGLEFE